MKITIILPTYNEKENIKILLPKIEGVIKNIKKHDIKILVVDDNSPDKTFEIVEKMQKKYDNIHLLVGGKRGLGVAYLRGFDYAINKLDSEVVVMMDADLSHPPDLLPVLINNIEKGYDLVIGSRYIKGGGTPDWSIIRRLVSKLGNFLARRVGTLNQIRDCTSGFRAIKTGILKKINLNNVNTKGYAFLSTLLYELIRLDSKVKEIPLVFYDRKYGETKLNIKDMLEFLFNIIKIRLYHRR